MWAVRRSLLNEADVSDDQAVALLEEYISISQRDWQQETLDDIMHPECHPAIRSHRDALMTQLDKLVAMDDTQMAQPVPRS